MDNPLLAAIELTVAVLVVTLVIKVAFHAAPVVRVWSHRRRGHALSPFTRRTSEREGVWEIDSLMCDCGVWMDRRRRLERR